MNVQINGFVIYDEMRARNPEIWPQPYRFSEIEAYGSDATVCPATITLEVPDDFDPRPGQIESLKARERELHAEYTAAVTAIQRQISQLQAIENNAEPAR